MVLCNDYQKNIKLRRLLRKYRQRKDRLEVRRIEWFHMMKKKPNPDKPDPEDVNAIEHAKETVGDYQLKTAQGIISFLQSFSLPIYFIYKETRKMKPLKSTVGLYNTKLLTN